MSGVEVDNLTTVVVEESEVHLTSVVQFLVVGQMVVTSVITIKTTLHMVLVDQVDTSIVSVDLTVNMV